METGQFDPTIVLLFFFFVAIIFTAGYGFSLLYHWLRWGHMYPLVWVALPIYAGGVGVLFLILLGSMAF